jgi:Ca-activated chloride channel family protein
MADLNKRAFRPTVVRIGTLRTKQQQTNSSRQTAADKTAADKQQQTNSSRQTAADKQQQTKQQQTNSSRQTAADKQQQTKQQQTKQQQTKQQWTKQQQTKQQQTKQQQTKQQQTNSSGQNSSRRERTSTSTSTISRSRTKNQKHTNPKTSGRPGSPHSKQKTPSQPELQPNSAPQLFESHFCRAVLGNPPSSSVLRVPNGEISREIRRPARFYSSRPIARR